MIFALNNRNDCLLLFLQAMCMDNVSQEKSQHNGCNHSIKSVFDDFSVFSKDLLKFFPGLNNFHIFPPAQAENNNAPPAGPGVH
jgi:hypothetical protein